MRVVIEGVEHTVDIDYIHPRSGGKTASDPLTPEWAARHQPEHFIAIREMVNSHYKRNKPGLTYFSSTGQLISHESRLESLALLLLDWEGKTAAIAAQPFTLTFNRSRKPAAHTPDYFARLQDGTGVVIDVKPAAFLTKADIETQHGIAEEVARQSGWQYRVISDIHPQDATNLHLLAGYRLTPPGHDTIERHITNALTDGPVEYGDLKSKIAESTRTHPALVAPHILHALWTRRLMTPMSQELTNTSPIALTEGARK